MAKTLQRDGLTFRDAYDHVFVAWVWRDRPRKRNLLVLGSMGHAKLAAELLPETTIEFRADSDGARAIRDICDEFIRQETNPDAQD